MSTRAIIDRVDGEIIKLVDPNERYCHVEFTSDAAEVWELKEWRNCYERKLVKDKLRELEAEAREKTAVYIDKLATAIAELCPMMEEGQLLELARELIRRKAYVKAAELGVEIPREELLII